MLQDFSQPCNHFSTYNPWKGEQSEEDFELSVFNLIDFLGNSKLLLCF